MIKFYRNILPKDINTKLINKELIPVDLITHRMSKIRTRMKPLSRQSSKSKTQNNSKCDSTLESSKYIPPLINVYSKTKPVDPFEPFNMASTSRKFSNINNNLRQLINGRNSLSPIKNAPKVAVVSSRAKNEDQTSPEEDSTENDFKQKYSTESRKSNLFWDLDKEITEINHNDTQDEDSKWKGFETLAFNSFAENDCLQITHLNTIKINRKSNASKVSLASNRLHTLNCRTKDNNQNSPVKNGDVNTALSKREQINNLGFRAKKINHRNQSSVGGQLYSLNNHKSMRDIVMEIDPIKDHNIFKNLSKRRIKRKIDYIREDCAQGQKFDLLYSIKPENHINK